MCPAHGNRANAWGMVLVMWISLVMSARTRVPFDVPPGPPSASFGMGQRRADAPNWHTLPSLHRAMSNPRNRQLHLHSTLRPQQFMPFVHHHHLGSRQSMGPAFLGEEDVERLGGRDQHIRQNRPLLGFFFGRRVTCPRAHHPIQTQTLGHFPRGIRDVGRQRPQWSNPNELDPSTAFLLADSMSEDVAHGRIRFATARWGLQQPVAPLHAACQTSRWKG